MSANAAKILVKILEQRGTERVFCVPGESYLAVLDALHDSSIETITCRQEGGAAMMAEADGKMTGKPGICFVTRGPGATNASAGVHIAKQDTTPMILFIGQVARKNLGREAFQEIDYHAFFSPIAKWAGQIDDANDLPDILDKAYALAMEGRPGPVVIALPEDMLHDQIQAPLPITQPAMPKALSKEQLRDLQLRLAQAKRPFIIVGGSKWSPHSVASLQQFAENWGLPVGCSFRRQMLFDHTHPNYAGDVGIGINPKLAQRIKNADLVLLLGARFSEMASSDYTLLTPPKPVQDLIHIYPSKDELGRVYHADLAIEADPEAFAPQLASLVPSQSFASSANQAHHDYLDWSTPPQTGPGAVQMGPIMQWLEANSPQDAIWCNGAGNYATWVHRFHRFQRYETQLAPTSGSMGYGVPAAIAAKLRHPERQVYAFAGDGCFMMHGQEFATAMHHGANVIFIVVNNGIYGTIRMHQERDYPARISATTLTNPDFAALARAYGGHGEIVAKTADFAQAFERAKQAGKPALIEIKLDPEAITPMKTLAQFRAKT